MNVGKPQGAAWAVCGRLLRSASVAACSLLTGLAHAGDVPGYPGNGIQRPCTAAEFRWNDLNTDAALLSRHTFCAKYLANDVSIYMYTMPSADGKSYVPYRRSAGLPASLCVLGRAKFLTKYEAWGAAPRLSIDHRIQLSLQSFSTTDRSSNCPTGSGQSIVITPIMPGASSLSTYDGPVSNYNVSYSAISLPMSLTRGSSASADFTATVSWTSGEQGSWVKASLIPERMEYQVAGSESPVGVPANSFWGGGWAPYLRCDQGLLPGNSSAGCVYSDAAAVRVVDSAKYPEIAAHIREAMAGTSPGMSGGAPGGGFAVLEGTRAVAAVGTQSPLFRLQPSEVKANRAAACGGAPSSVISTYPNASASCAGSVSGSPVTGCSCDEYPFASTWNGAAYSPSYTSSKFVQHSENQGDGSAHGGFYTKERVLPGEAFWVHVK